LKKHDKRQINYVSLLKYNDLLFFASIKIINIDENLPIIRCKISYLSTKR